MVTACDELKSATDETQFHLFRFLKDKSDQSFTVEELANNLSRPGNVANLGMSADDPILRLRLQKMLDDMVRASFVVESAVDGQPRFGFNAFMNRCNLTRLGNHLWMFC